MASEAPWGTYQKNKSRFEVARSINKDQLSKADLRQQEIVNRRKSSEWFVVTAMWFLVGLFFSHQPACRIAPPADLPTARGDPHSEYHWNCGLNAAYIALRLLHKHVSIYSLGQEINAGAYLERNVSFLDLKKLFERYELNAEGFKADYPEEIIQFAKADRVLIVRMASPRGHQGVGHFIVVKGARDYVIVIDPPYHPKKFTRQDIIKHDILSRTTGEFLLVY
jgi:hypothetical protein